MPQAPLTAKHTKIVEYPLGTINLYGIVDGVTSMTLKEQDALRDNMLDRAKDVVGRRIGWVTLGLEENSEPHPGGEITTYGPLEVRYQSGDLQLRIFISISSVHLLDVGRMQTKLRKIVSDATIAVFVDIISTSLSKAIEKEMEKEKGG